MSAAMSIEECLEDYRLLDLIAVLSHRGDSGQLQIDCGSAHGSLYFDKGKIAVARMGSLTGFSALNLAISLERTRLRFDSHVEIPASEFTDPNERHLLNKLLGIETAVPGPAHDLNDSTGCSARALAAEPVVAPPSLEVTPPALEGIPLLSELPPPMLEVPPPTLQVPPRSLEVTLPSSETELTGKTIDWWKNVGPAARSLPSFVNQSGTYNTRQKMTVRASSILLIAGLAAVGITAFRSRANRSTALNVSHDTTATATSGRNGVPTATPGKDKRIPLNVNKTNSIPPGPGRSMPETTLKNQAIVSSPAPAEAGPREKTRAVSGEPVKGESFDEAKRPAPLVFKEIPVMVRIEDGHVAEAYLKNRNTGSEGYEATALRVARERRYPKDTTGVETIIVHVANEH